MIGLRDFSIKNKLVLMQVLTCVLVLGLCFAAFVITDINGYKGRKVASTISFAQVIGSNSISAIQFLDNEAAEKTLFDLQEVETDVVNASIVDSRGKIFAAYTRPNQTTHVFKPPFRNRHWFDDQYLYVYKNIVDQQGQIFGTVCLQVELSQLEAIKKQKFEIAFVLLFVGIALAFLIAYLNQRYISAPILNLVNVMKQIRENSDYSRHVDVIGKDEISILSSEFNNLMDEVANSHRKKDEFIGIASHELKTPLTSVKLYLDALSKMKHEPLVHTFILKSKDGVKKLHNLILDLLDVSKIESGQLQLNHKDLSIDDLIDECIQDAQMNIVNHTILREGTKCDKIIHGDRDRLEQVLINLLSNAAKYSPNGTSIAVKTVTSDNDITVSVTDSGIGIAGSEHKKIFGRFYRAKDSNSVISGFGLGLYICSQIIKRHKGKIGVDSQEGKGSTFYFTLPLNGEQKLS
ncbi:ATP-binding protein [Daejeonella lutea]|uniref:histidine kinase n=1 Tax=Daejeonella lutea TaxID=572036 RepID=A0A1T5BXJ9_9SPHI|nr:ATP-binding protein [Daejeonella lutea]SKB51723.1 Signal transduction histidine kinase [Daejeonella lutea]